MTEKTEPPTKEISFFSLAMILITVVLSAIALFLGLTTYNPNHSENSGALSYMLIGFIGLAISVYLLLQTQKKPSRVALEMPRVITTIICQKCGFKNIRDFQRGDYIFKETEPCPKCNEKTMITSIYREVKEKEK
jgi:hypothetical protein